MATAPPSLLRRIGRNIGALTALSVLTSLAFNRAVLAREREEQHRLHHLQMSLLLQLHGQLSSSLPIMSPSPLLSSPDEQRKLARRLRTLELDPLRLGFSPAVLPSEDEETKLRQAREASTSWSTALFGSGVAAKVREALGRVTEEIRGQGIGFGTGSSKASKAEDQADEEWLRALEETMSDGSAREETDVAAPVPEQSVAPAASLREDRDRPTSGIGSPSLASAGPEQGPAPRTATAQRRRMYL